MTTRFDISKIRIKTTPTLAAQPTKAEVARVRRRAKRAGFIFMKSRARQPVYGLQDAKGIFATSSLASIERKISAAEAGKAKKRRKTRPR